MRLFFACVFVVALVVLVAQLRADPQPVAPGMQQNAQPLPLIVATGFPEPVSTVFILGGAAAMVLWRVARKLEVI